MDVYDDISSFNAGRIEPKMDREVHSELAQWFNGYIKQAAGLLNIISTCRQGVYENYLGALEEQVEV